MQHLTTGTTLQNGKYKIERVLGQGGFGITYLAEQPMLGRKVAVKEFFLRGLCLRKNTEVISKHEDETKLVITKYKDKFLKEAQILCRLNHPNIVHVYDVFVENNTAYFAMEYIEGRSLKQIVEEKGKIEERWALMYIRKLVKAIEYIHSQKINHLDIKPANILIRDDDESVVLIDFGISKQYDLEGEQTSTTPVGISPGYSPIEQYQNGGVHQFSPQTDIYSIGATLYNLLTGEAPSENNINLYEYPVDPRTAYAITQAMQTNIKARPKTIRAFVKILPSNWFGGVFNLFGILYSQGTMPLIWLSTWYCSMFFVVLLGEHFENFYDKLRLIMAPLPFWVISFWASQTLARRRILYFLLYFTSFTLALCCGVVQHEYFYLFRNTSCCIMICYITAGILYSPTWYSRCLHILNPLIVVLMVLASFFCENNIGYGFFAIALFQYICLDYTGYKACNKTYLQESFPINRKPQWVVCLMLNPFAWLSGWAMYLVLSYV